MMTSKTNRQAPEIPIVRATGPVRNRAKQLGVRLAEVLVRGRIMDAIAGFAHARKVAAEYEDLVRRGVSQRELSRWLTEKL